MLELRGRIQLAEAHGGEPASRLHGMAGRQAWVNVDEIVFELYPPTSGQVVMTPLERMCAERELEELFLLVGKGWPSTN